MRPSNRNKILDAALRVAEREGVTAVTLESVAGEAGLTKSGLMYHFPSRVELLAGVETHMSAHWELVLRHALGKPVEQATAAERVAAYASVAAASASSADLAFILEFSKHPRDEAAWADVAGRWTPSAEDAVKDPAILQLFLARLAADGLWAYESLQGEPLDPRLRGLLVERIAALAGGADEPAEP